MNSLVTCEKSRADDDSGARAVVLALISRHKRVFGGDGASSGPACGESDQSNALHGPAANTITTGNAEPAENAEKFLYKKTLSA